MDYYKAITKHQAGRMHPQRCTSPGRNNNNMNKNIYIGSIEQEEWSGRLNGMVKRTKDINIHVTISNGKLSISGDIGRDSGGQIDMEFEHKDPKQNDERYTDNLIKAEDIEFAPGWDKDKWFELLNIWSKWHLNDMNPSCEHQQALGWLDIAGESVKIYKWKLEYKTSRMQSDIQDKALENIKAKQHAIITKEQADILKLEYWVKTETPEAPSKHYKPDQDQHEETKKLGWLNESEHSRGILSKACPTCGYKYGSAWKERKLPGEVIAFLETL